MLTACLFVDIFARGTLLPEVDDIFGQVNRQVDCFRMHCFTAPVSADGFVEERHFAQGYCEVLSTFMSARVNSERVLCEC